MAIDKLKTTSIEDDAVTSAKIAPGTITDNDINSAGIGIAKLTAFNTTIAPEVLEINVDAPGAGADTPWLWTWETSSLPYARVNITNQQQSVVPIYKQGSYQVNNFANELHGSMTQTHSLYLKWIEGAGTDNLVSWATDLGSVAHSHPDINGGNSTQVQRLNVVVPSTVTAPTLTAPSVSYTVTNNGAGAYTFSGTRSGDNPNIGPMYRGGTYTFNITATGHPLYLTTDNGTNFAQGAYFGEYTNGVTGSRTDSGTLTFTVPSNAPNTLYYQCGNHSAMRGQIIIKDLAIETNNNGNMVVYFQHDQEGHANQVEIRPIPSLVDQMCLVYEAASGQFVPQDLATYTKRTPSFQNKIQEIAGTATIVNPEGGEIIPRVTIVQDATYLSLVNNTNGDMAFDDSSNVLYIWTGTQWEATGDPNAGAQQGVFYENSQILNTNYTITTGKSAMSAGPVELGPGVTVEIPTGSRWVIV